MDAPPPHRLLAAPPTPLVESHAREPSSEINVTPEDDQYPRRLLPDGRELVVYPLTYGRARLVVGPAGSMFYDNSW
jgi:hypothetical protein